MRLLTTIWERYFLKEMVKIFLFFLISFYTLYVLIDYSTHSHSFKNYHMSVWEIFGFYFSEFITRLDVLVPFALLISSVKVLCTLNTHNELIALMASGISIKRLLLPFIFFGFCCTCLLYFNIELFQPYTTKYQKYLSHLRSKAQEKKYRHQFVQDLNLHDGSTLIYHRYDPITETFSDVYWVRSIDDIYRISSLFFKGEEGVGKQVEHLQRDFDDHLVVVEFAENKSLPELHIDREQLEDASSSVSQLSLSSLQQKLPSDGHVKTEKEAQMVTYYYYKLALPWLCLFAVIGSAPFCVRFSRTFPLFLIYASSLFGLFVIYLILNAGLALGERQIISPFVAIWGPFTFFVCLFSYRLLRLR